MRKLKLMLLTVCLAVLAACSSTPVNTNTGSNAAATNSAPAANANTQSSAEQPEASSQREKTVGAAYPQDTRDAFLKSCQGAGSKQEFCVCVFEKVQAKYSYDSFKRIEEAMLDGEPPAEFVEFTQKTRDECMK